MEEEAQDGVTGIEREIIVLTLLAHSLDQRSLLLYQMEGLWIGRKYVGTRRQFKLSRNHEKIQRTAKVETEAQAGTKAGKKQQQQ